MTALEKYHRWGQAFYLSAMLAIASIAAILLLFSHGSVMDPELARFQVGTGIIVVSVLVIFLFARSWHSNWFGVLALGLAVTGPWWSYALGILLAIVWPLLADRPVRLPARVLGVLPVAMTGLAANLMPETVSGRDVTITVCCLIVGIALTLPVSWGMRKQLAEHLQAA